MILSQFRPSRRSGQGFSLPELLVVVAILSIVAGVTIPYFTRNLHNERLSASAKVMASWLDDARRQAIQKSLPCRIQIEANTGQLKADPDNRCGALETLDLRSEISGNQHLTMSWQGSDETSMSFSFTPRGTVFQTGNSAPIEVWISNNNESTDVKRCIKIMVPIGLIRVGRAIKTSGSEVQQCDYTTAL